MITIEDYLKEDIIGILKEASSGIDDGFGGIETGVFEETFEEVAIDIIKMIKGSYETMSNKRQQTRFSGKCLN